jgi:hypothetical protein
LQRGGKKDISIIEKIRIYTNAGRAVLTVEIEQNEDTISVS